MKRQLKPKLIFFLAGILMISSIPIYQFYAKAPINNTSLFSWNKSTINIENRAKLEYTIEKLNIGRLFQAFDSKSFDSQEMHEFMIYMSNKNISTYYLTGDPSWAFDGKYDRMKEKIDIVASWNKKVNKSERVSGIVFDVEPYTLDGWENDSESIASSYINNMKKAYKYANNNNLKVIICVPYWYDKEFSYLINALIQSCCDEVAVMNYYKGAEYKNIQTELKIAKYYNKSISTIFEFSEPRDGVPEKITYYTEGVDSAKNVFNSLYSSFKYNKLYCSYHYLDPIYEIIK